MSADQVLHPPAVPRSEPLVRTKHRHYMRLVQDTNQQTWVRQELETVGYMVGLWQSRSATSPVATSGWRSSQPQEHDCASLYSCTYSNQIVHLPQ